MEMNKKMKQKYNIDSEWDGHQGEKICFNGIIELEEEVINQIDDDWRENFYSSLITPNDIADHLAFNIIVNGATLSMLDGFANFPDDYAKIIND